MANEEKVSPELQAGLERMKDQLNKDWGYSKPEPVIEEKKEEPKVEEAKPVVKEKDDDISTWSDEQLQVLADSESSMAKDAEAILNKRGIDAMQSEEAKEIKALRKDLSRERTEANKAVAAEEAAQARKALEDRVRNGDGAAMGELLGNMVPMGGSLKGQFDTNAALESAKKIIEAENKAKRR